MAEEKDTKHEELKDLDPKKKDPKGGMTGQTGQSGGTGGRGETPRFIDD